MTEPLEVDSLKFFQDLGVLGEQLQVLSAQKGADIDQVLRAMEHKMVQFIDTYSLEERRIQHAAQIAVDLQEFYQRLFNKEIVFLTSGIPALDTLLLGFMPDCVYLFVARPGAGKTSLLMSLARNMLQDGKTIYVASAEMSNRALGQRLVGYLTGIAVANQMPGITPLELEQLNDGAIELSDKHLYSNDTPCIAIEAIDADLRFLTQNGVVVDAVFIDYVQLVRSRRAAVNAGEYEMATAVSNATTLLAKKYHIPVLAAAQQNREVEKRTNKEAKLSDIRGSGGLEADAHLVAYIHNEKPATASDDRVIRVSGSGIPIIYESEIQVAKHRNGPTGWVKVKYNAPLMEFSTEEESLPVQGSWYDGDD